MRRQRWDGFTLIELLTVVSLIALLAALLFPVFAQAREKSRQVVCINHLKQLTTAMLIYCDDNDDLFPPALGRERDEKPAFPVTWMGFLQPYVRSTAVFVDPASGHPNPDWHTCNDLLANYGYPPSRRAYGLQGQVVTADPVGAAMWEGLGGFYGPPIGHYLEEVPSCRRTQIARPTETILLCDHLFFDWGMTAKKLYYPAPRHLREPNLPLADGSSIPEGWINAAFVDGHVQALRQEQLWAILPDYSRLARPSSDVFRHFWPYE